MVKCVTVMQLYLMMRDEVSSDIKNKFPIKLSKTIYSKYCYVQRTSFLSLFRSAPLQMLSYTLFYSILSVFFYFVLYCIVLHCIILYCTVLYCIELFYIALNCLYCIISYYMILYCIILYRIELYCTVSFRFVSFRFVSFRFVSFRFVSFRIVLYCFVLFCFILFHSTFLYLFNHATVYISFPLDSSPLLSSFLF